MSNDNQYTHEISILLNFDKQLESLRKSCISKISEIMESDSSGLTSGEVKEKLIKRRHVESVYYGLELLRICRYTKFHLITEIHNSKAPNIELEKQKLLNDKKFEQLQEMFAETKDNISFVSCPDNPKLTEECYRSCKFSIDDGHHGDLKKVIVCGSSGCGKTTWIKKIKQSSGLTSDIHSNTLPHEFPGAIPTVIPEVTVIN